jgi:hypothetical protein
VTEGLFRMLALFSSLDFLPILPGWVIFLLAAALLATLVHGSLHLRQKQVPRRWLWILGSLRVAAVIAFVLALLQPVLSYTRMVEEPPDLAVLVDTSQSMGLPGGTDQGSRLREIVPPLLAGDLASSLRDRYRLHWFAFDSSAYPVKEAEVAGLKPVGASTRYAKSLTAAWNQLRATGVTPERLLLVSDGNDHGASDPVETAHRLGLVIDTLAPSPASPSSAASAIVLADVQSAPRVLLGSETHFRVTLRRPLSSRSDQSLTLRLAEDGKNVRKQKVVFQRGRTEQTIPVAYRPTSPGTKEYTFRLKAPGSSGAGKPYRLSVQVLDNKNEVLILEDTWRWEFKFLRRLFEEDPSFRFTALLARGRGSFMHFGSPKRRVNLVGFPQSRAELEGFDTIILGDVNPNRWPRGLASAIAQLVTEEGKSLMVIAGTNLKYLAEVPELNRLLPVVITRQSARPMAGPVPVRISSEGIKSPFFFQSSDSTPVKLPPLDQIYAPLRKRPAATVLLEAAKQGNAHGNLIVVAEHTVGRGRVLYLGTDTLWKWQTLAPQNQATATPYSLFWQQTFRALTPVRANLGGVHLWLQPHRSRYEVRRPVLLRAEIQSARPVPQPKIQATVILPDKRHMPLAFAVDPAEPTFFRAEFESPLPGTYRVKAAVLSAGKTAAEGATVLYVEEGQAEQSDIRIDRINLARIAAGTGGKVIDLARADTWSESGDQPNRLAAQTRTLDLWNNFTLVLLICGLLGADWILRLRKGYM